MKNITYNLDGSFVETEFELSQEDIDRLENGNKARHIVELKQLLQKYKEDVEQVELFGMERADYEEKKQMCADIIIELRQLEKEIRDGK